MTNKKNLSTQFCEPCQEGAEPMTQAEIKKSISELDSDWTVLDNKKLRRTFKFKNFQQALDFVVKVGEIAEEQDHHPEIKLHDYKQATIEWWTHKINGLHTNDFIMAAKTDKLI